MLRMLLSPQQTHRYQRISKATFFYKINIFLFTFSSCTANFVSHKTSNSLSLKLSIVQPSTIQGTMPHQVEPGRSTQTHQPSRDPRSTHVESQVRRAATLPVPGQTSARHGRQALPVLKTPAIDDSRSLLTVNATNKHPGSIEQERIPPRGSEIRIAESSRDVFSTRPNLKDIQFPDLDTAYMSSLYQVFMLLPKNVEPRTMMTPQKQALSLKLSEFWRDHGIDEETPLLDKLIPKLQSVMDKGDEEAANRYKEWITCVKFHDRMFDEIHKARQRA